MPYSLGIDLGTSFSAAGVGHPDGRVDIFQLGERAAVIPSVVILRADGQVLVGEAAERRSLTEPSRTAREFKRRLGDPVPLILGGTPYGPEALIAILLRAIVDRVAEQLGEPPGAVVVTHPATYGPYKLDLLRQAVRQADLDAVSFLEEPVAAAIHYASQEHVPAGAVIAIYDFGGGTFDATILRQTEDGFDLLGNPEGLERLGGVDFDEAIFRHVAEAIGEPFRSLDPADPATLTAIARLREECRRAKEALSSDTDVTIPVFLPNKQTEIRLTRNEFERMIDPRIAETVAALGRAARSAGVAVHDLDRILLVGGTSRIPLIAEKVREATGRPVALDAHPKYGVALGAALRGLSAMSAGPEVAPTIAAVPSNVVGPVASSTADAVSGPQPASSAQAAMAPDSPAAADAAEAALPGTRARSGVAVPPAAGTPPQRALPRSAAPGERPRGRSEAVLAAAIVVAVLIAGSIFAVGSGLLGGAASSAIPSPATSVPSSFAAVLPTLPTAPTAIPLASAEPTVDAGPSARITDITVTGGSYEVAFTTTGFSPSLSEGTMHVHFFFDTVPPTEAGVPGSGPWTIYGGASPFTELAPTDRPSQATAMCILVANHDHTVIQGTGNCLALP